MSSNGFPDNDPSEAQSGFDIIIPTFNSSEFLEATVNEILQEDLIPKDARVILVDDGSTDETWEIVKAIGLEDRRVLGLRLPVNVGQHEAVFEGLRICRRDVVVMDDDGQNPPGEIAQLIRFLREGHDLVFARPLKSRHSRFRRLTSATAVKTLQRVYGCPAEIRFSNFKAMNKTVVGDLLCLPGAGRYINGEALSVSTNPTTISVRHRHAARMESGYSLTSLIKLYLRALRVVPMRLLQMMISVGVVVGLVGIIMSLVVTIRHLLNSEMVPGWTSLVVFVSVFGSLNLISLGFLGEMIGRHVTARPPISLSLKTEHLDASHD